MVLLILLSFINFEKKKKINIKNRRNKAKLTLAQTFDFLIHLFLISNFDLFKRSFPH